MPRCPPNLCLSLAVVVLLGGCAGGLRELMPAPAVLGGPDATVFYQEVPPARRETGVDLLYVTDRAPGPAAEDGAPYGQVRARRLMFGSAAVRVLPPMGWEEFRRHSLAEPRAVTIGMALGAVRELGRYPFEPYPVVRTAAGSLRRDPEVLARHERADAAVQAEVQRRLAAAPSKQVLLYVHGFNETFASAAYTAAELCHFLGRRDVCAFFTWPASAHGNPLISYTATTESALYSVGHLKKVIRTLARTPGVEGMQLLAHSRGAAVLLNACRELAIEAVAAGEAPAEAFKIENIVLMSPDIDGGVAGQQVEVFVSDPGLTTRWTEQEVPRFIRRRLTIYASPEDRALWLSQILFRSVSRLGQLTPSRVSPAVQEILATSGNIDIVVYEGKRTDFFGHSYFLSNPEVSADLIELVRNGTPPGGPGRPLLREGPITWVFPPMEDGRSQ